jgi:hypothetical protein
MKEAKSYDELTPPTQPLIGIPQVHSLEANPSAAKLISWP